MSEDAALPRPIPMPDAAQVARAIRLTYIQMMLNAVFGASTGGMFLIGFALALGADNLLIGLMSTVPQFFVVCQFVAAYFVERGVSRKKITVRFAFLTPLCWFFIAAIPFFAPVMDRPMRFTVLIGVMAMVTVAGQFAGNARGSWIGELVPAKQRGRFFGYCTLFAGIVGAVFAIVEGRFLDFIKSNGLFAFTSLFFFGVIFGFASAFLNIPQPDCPLPGGGKGRVFWGHLRGALRNRPFVLLALVHATIALGGIAGPFNAVYCLRDVGVSFFGLGLLNAVATTAVLIFSPFWGKLADRVGCRPILILGLLILAPCATVWLLVPPGQPLRAYLFLPWTNFLAGVGSAAVNVAISTLTYKNSKPEGRSVQFAGYSTFVTLIGAPMPLLGGWLVLHLAQAGYAVDLRITFFLWSVFMFLAALLATRLEEPGSLSARHLAFRHLPALLRERWHRGPTQT